MQRGVTFLVAVLGASAAIVLTGCGGSSDDDSPSATAAPVAATTAAAPASEAVTSAAAEPAAADAAAGAVHLKLLSFTPDALDVPAGTTVEWVDDNPIAHTITSGAYEVGADGLRTSETPDGTFDGKVATTGDTFTFTFAQPGTYTYYCAIHKGMNATLVVSA